MGRQRSQKKIYVQSIPDISWSFLPAVIFNLRNKDEVFGQFDYLTIAIYLPTVYVQ